MLVYQVKVHVIALLSSAHVAKKKAIGARETLLYCRAREKTKARDMRAREVL